MLVYAPRNLEEVEVVMRIVGAGMGRASGGEMGWVDRAAECTKGVVVDKELAVKAMKDWADLGKERERVLK